jgi:hypothetical protein
MRIILELLEYINVKSKSLLENIHENNPIFFEYIYGNNPRSIRDIMVKSKSRSMYTMAKKGKKHIRES